MDNYYYIDNKDNLNDIPYNHYKDSNIKEYSPFIGMFFLLFISLCVSCLPPRSNNTSDLEIRQRLLVNNLPVLIIENDIDDSCSICLEKYKLNDMINRLNCNHIYHKECLDNWIQNNNCPLCRSIII
tara:strand:- start:5061 stop:5441 length:381 start_codon:yes stop_codon:yes gene_type:complete